MKSGCYYFDTICDKYVRKKNLFLNVSVLIFCLDKTANVCYNEIRKNQNKISH